MLKKLNLKNTYRLIEGFLASHKGVRILVLIFVSLVLSIPGVDLGRSRVERPIDLKTEDALYCKELIDDDRIAVVAITAGSDADYISGNNIAILSELVTALNSAPEGRPAVIGIADDIYLEPGSHDYFRYIDLLKESNVVLGVTYDTSCYGIVGDEDLFDTPLSLNPLGTSAVYNNNSIVAGHTVIVTDCEGTVRHYLWSASSDDGSEIPSFASRCCSLWSDATGSELVLPRCSDDGLFIMTGFSGSLPENMLDAERIMAPDFTGRATAGKIVLIGACDSLVGNEYVTNASSRIVTGNAGVQANAIASVLNGKVVRECPLNLQLLVLGLVSALLVLAIFSYSFISAVSVGVIFFALNLIASAWLRLRWCIAVHPLFICVSVCFDLIIGMFLRLSNAKRNQAAETNILNRYMDTSVRNRILFRHQSGAREVGDKRPMAILHADIKNFSSIIEERSAEESIEILNSYFSVADKCIHANGGVLDNFSGSSVTAFWDDEENGGEAALKACRAALDISNGIRSVDDSLFEKYHHEVSFSMGVHFGDTVLGDIGSENRKSFTIAGNAFETAKALKNKATKGSVYISHTVHEKLGALADDALLPDRIKHYNHLEYEQVYLLNDLFDPTTETSDAMSVETAAAETAEREYTLYVLGTRGSYHVSGKRFVEFGGQTTCYILKTGTHAVVIDCGTGLYEAREILKNCTSIDVIISHVHYDHCIGLLDWSIFPSTAELCFYGNFRGWLGNRTINEMFRPPFWPVDPVSGKMVQIPAWGKRLFLKDSISFVFYPAPHPNEAAIMSMNAGSKKICIMVDCEQSNVLPMDILRGSDLLIYDGMYDDSEYKNHIGWGHSTWQEGVRLAQKAGIEHLMISHHSPKNNDSVLLEYERLAQSSFPNTIFARVGMTLKF